MSNIQQIEEQIDKIQNNNMKLFEIFQTVMELPENKNPETLKVTPTKEYQEHRGLYNVVTVDGDADLKPENIKEGTSIFGVEGNAKTTDAKITDGSYLFYYGRRLDILDELLELCENIDNAKCMFNYCRNITELDVSNLNTSNVTDMSNMFAWCTEVTSLDVSNWNTGNVTTMDNMFSTCSRLTSLDVSNWNTSNVTKFNVMFSGCTGLTELDVSNWNTGNVTTMESMFSTCNNLTSLDVSNWNTSNVTNMRQTFSSCSSLTSLDVSNFNTSNVTTMESMFSSCNKLTSLDVSNWNTNNVTNMSGLFYGCSGLTSLDLSNFDTSNVTTMHQMFHSCKYLKYLDIRNFVFDKVTSYNSMFYNIPNDCLIIVKDVTAKNWVLARRSDLTNVKTLDELHLKSIEINASDTINTYAGNKNEQVYITYNGGDADTFYPDEMGYTLTITGNATIDENGLITLNDNANIGDKLTVTVVSTYDNSITATTEIEVIYKEVRYEINLNNGEWVDSGEVVNGNIVYKSDANSYNIKDGKSIATITTVGITNLKLYIRSYAEGGYDYTEAFPIDTDAVRSNGLYTTKSKQSATNYIECNYELDGGTHTIQIMYSKDGSGNDSDDRGYFYIGKYN